jgi:hypothetical protein
MAHATNTTKTTAAEVATEIAADVNARLARGEQIFLANHLRIVKLTKKHVGAVSADGAGIRIYGRNFMPVGTFAVRVSR